MALEEPKVVCIRCAKERLERASPGWLNKSNYLLGLHWICPSCLTPTEKAEADPGATVRLRF